MEPLSFSFDSFAHAGVKHTGQNAGKFPRDICIYENKSIYSHIETFNLNIIYS